MRRFAVLVACVALAGCGGGEEEGGAESVRWLDPRSDATIALDLDYYGSGHWNQIKRLYARAYREGALGSGDFTPPTLDAGLTLLAGFSGLSVDDDLRPLLGGTLHAGVRIEPAVALPAAARELLERLDPSVPPRQTANGPVYIGRDGKPLRGVARGEVEAALRQQSSRRPFLTITAAYRAPESDDLARVLEKLKRNGIVEGTPIGGIDDAQLLSDGVAVVGGDTIVVVSADGVESPERSRRLLRERLAAAGEEGPTVPALDGAFAAVRAAPTVLGAWLDREELSRALDTPPGRALRGAEGRLRLEEDAARASARVDFDGMAADELPLPEPGPLELPPGAAVAGASANQSMTTVFLARLARELYPESRFVQRVERLERELGVSFEDEVLRQFAGPSFTVLPYVGIAGDLPFAARSSLRDPTAMRGLLARLAPTLPGLLEALQGLGTTGLTGLLFVAPDAPLTPSAFGLLAALHVDELASAGSEELYEISGLDRGGVQPGPDRVVYGLIGDAFVVASTRELAREVAAMPTEPAAEAGTRLRVDIAKALERPGMLQGDNRALILRKLLDSLEASASAQDGDIVGDAELRWAR